MKQSPFFSDGFRKQLAVCVLLLCLAASLSAQQGTHWEDPTALHYSQVNVSHQLWDKNLDRFGEKDNSCFYALLVAMKDKGSYQGFPPIDVVEMSENQMMSIDNRRLLAAEMLGYKIEIVKHLPTDPLPKEHHHRIKPEWLRANPGPLTWGSFAKYRLSQQDQFSPEWSKNNPNGSRDRPAIQLRGTDQKKYKQAVADLGLALGVNDDDDGNDEPPSGGGAARIRTTTNISTEVEHIRQIKRNNGDIPGGILLNEVSGKIKGLSPKSVRFDFERSAFVVNGNYTFETWLAPEEVAELARVAASYDPRLGVLSQKEGINLRPGGLLMPTLTAADACFGPIAYGFDMRGNALQDAPDGYENPYESQVDAARWWLFHWDEVMRQGDAVLSGQEPRYFLDFKEFTFSPDVRSYALVADQMGIQFNYQVFTTNWTGQETFAAEPEKAEPYISRAIEHLRTHYADYEAHNADLLRTRHIATTFAFLKCLLKQRTVIENWGELTSLHGLDMPYTYDFYANMHPDCDQARWAAQALAALEWVPTIFISEDAELRLTWLMLQYAANAQDLEKIAQYRKKAQSLLDGLSESSAYYVSRQKLMAELVYQQSTAISGKLDFANRYRESHPAMAKGYYRTVAEYYEKVTIAEPDAFLPHFQLAWIMEALGEDQRSKGFRQKGLELALLAADQGNMIAQYMVGDAYLDEQFGTIQLDKAEEYLRKAAEQGYPKAALKIGYLLGYTKGYHQDQTAALSYFQQAADLGLPEGLYCVASCLRAGLGTEQDHQKSYMLMRQSAEANHANAQLALGQMLRDGTGTRRDRAQARWWFKRAADQGLADARRELQNI